MDLSSFQLLPKPLHEDLLYTFLSEGPRQLGRESPVPLPVPRTLPESRSPAPPPPRQQCDFVPVMDPPSSVSPVLETEGPSSSAGNPGEDPLLVMVVEDQPVNQKVACALLRKLNTEPVVADSGRMCLELLQGEGRPFDVIFMDIQMPDMDGLQTTARLRELESQGQLRRVHPNTPMYVVAMTASALAQEKEECFLSGMDNHIAKPVRRSLLQAAIQQCREARRTGILPPSKRKDAFAVRLPAVISAGAASTTMVAPPDLPQEGGSGVRFRRSTRSRTRKTDT